MRLLTLLAVMLLGVTSTLAPTSAKAASHGISPDDPDKPIVFVLWDEITGHSGEIVQGLVAHGDHLAFNRSLDTIQRTANNFSNDAEVATLLANMSALQSAYTAAPEAALTDATAREHYASVHTMHDLAAATALRLTMLAPRNADVIAMNADLRLNRALLGSDALCGTEALGANGTFLSDQLWDVIENAPEQTHWQALESIVNQWFFPALLGSLFLLMCIALAPIMLNQQRKALTT